MLREKFQTLRSSLVSKRAIYIYILLVWLSQCACVMITSGMNWIGPYLSESGGHSNATWSLILSFLDRCVDINCIT